MNEVVSRNTALPANFGENLMKGIAETRSTITVGDGGKPLLRLLKTGKWVFGQNNEPVEPDSEWAVNIASLARGWVAWDDGELLGQTMASVQVERVPQPPPVNGVPFVEQFSVELTCISGDNDGTLILYKNNSVGFKRAFEKLLSDIQTRWSADKAYFWPVITLAQESYNHSKYGETWNPILSVVAWTDQDGEFAPDSEPVQKVEPVEPPKVARSRQATQRAPEEPLPTAQTHTGQRRRPAAR